jgi:hypothetical protein
MTFRETLDKHLRAIRERDLPSFVETLPDETLTLVTSDGRIVESVREVVAMHRGWFESPTWSLGTEIVALDETPQMGRVTILLDYRDKAPDGGQTRQASVLTLVFTLCDGRWVMTFDQNTPIK